MREAVFLLILLLMSALFSCSAIGMGRSNIDPSWEGRKKQILVWATAEKTRVDRGTLNNSEYWKQFYRKSIELRPDLDDFLCFADEMIKVSRIFEEGNITKEQFEHKYQQLTALLAQEEERRTKMGSLATMDYEANLFTLYDGSLFSVYINDLRKRLNAEGPQFSSSRCAFFGGSIKCIAQNPPL